MSNELNITWERWNNEAITYTYSISKAHAEDLDRDGMTLCGMRIPEEGNGIVHEHPSTHNNDECKKCLAKVDKM
jgi:hypothetical protein